MRFVPFFLAIPVRRCSVPGASKFITCQVRWNTPAVVWGWSGWLAGSERFADHLSGTVMLVSGGLVLYCLVMITIPDLAFRGLIQRFADGLLFGWLALASAMQLAKPEPYWPNAFCEVDFQMAKSTADH